MMMITVRYIYEPHLNAHIQTKDEECKVKKETYHRTVKSLFNESVGVLLLPYIETSL